MYANRNVYLRQSPYLFRKKQIFINGKNHEFKAGYLSILFFVNDLETIDENIFKQS